MTSEKRIRYLLATIGLFFMIGILMSVKLWLTNRFFPHAPVGGFFPVLPTPFDFILLGLVLAGLAWTVFKYKRWLIIALLSVLLIILLQDQMRWQPWVFMYALMLLPFALINSENLKKEHQIILNCLQIILIGMYLWGGLHKLTPSFFNLTFPGILKGLFKITDEALLNNLAWLGFFIPIIEILVALGLIIKKTRNTAVIMGIGTHVFILAYLSPLGINHNEVVYPWNIALIIMVYLAFFNYEEKIVFWPKNHRLAIGISILFACILPALNMIDKWDKYLSFKLYTGDMEDLYVLMKESDYANLPGPIKTYCYEVEGAEDLQQINVGRWAFGELKVPVNPEPRVFKQISEGICIYLNNSQATFMEITRGKEPRHIKRQYNCQDLQ